MSSHDSRPIPKSSFTLFTIAPLFFLIFIHRFPQAHQQLRSSLGSKLDWRIDLLTENASNPDRSTDQCSPQFRPHLCPVSYTCMERADECSLLKGPEKEWQSGRRQNRAATWLAVRSTEHRGTPTYQRNHSLLIKSLEAVRLDE